MPTITLHRLSELPDMIITTDNIFEVENVGVFKILNMQVQVTITLSKLQNCCTLLLLLKL